MAYDLQEQEQIESLKAWWNQYGNLVTGLLTLILVVVAGVNGWKWYQRSQASQAVVYYEALEKAVTAKDAAKVKDAAGALLDKYGSTAYAQMAALLAAKTYADGGDMKSAKAQLQWAMDKAKDEEYKHIARLRLAGILLDEKAYEEALKLVSIEPPPSYVSLYADRKGDVLLAMGKKDEAKTAYQVALDRAEKNGNVRQIIQLKLEALGA
jgi:predicted negative regulator of RcsB-dependent stress response